MSEYPFPDRASSIMLEVAADGPAETEVPDASGVLMPFEPHSQDAEALRGALSFLFTLISLYSELVEATPARDGDAGDCGGMPN
ncbi:MAG: hypothetical protein ACLPWS_00115 [Rhodomicrobium sp.]